MNTSVSMMNILPIEALRQAMLSRDLDAYIVPSSDPHLNEYIPDHWQFRKWISGFSGSAGTVVVTKDFAGLWTDSRYFVQAEKQLNGSGIELVKLQIPHTPEFVPWLANHLKEGARVGLDDQFFTISTLGYIGQTLSAAGMTLLGQEKILDQLWADRPGLPQDQIFVHDSRYAGISRQEKLAQVHEILSKKRADLHLITTLDDIAWLLNLRGNDISFCPFFVSYCLTGPTGTILFIDQTKITASVREELEQDQITLVPYTQFPDFIRRITSGTRVYIAPERITGFVKRQLPSDVILVEGMNITTGLKAVKNRVEIEGLKRVMVKDGVAWVRLLSWLYRQLESGAEESEISIARKIAAFRGEQENYFGESFHPISSYDWHGSIVHYSVTEEESIPVLPQGIFLLDTGGHFLDGTTDTTRTITLGNTTGEQKTDFTLALKGTLGVSMLRFPKGTRGYQMDILARKALWDHALNYGHGTGHGVGFLLSVHEGPQTIGTSASGYMNVIMEPGMVTTVEPAIYREGSHGMRTENMTLVVTDITNEFGEFYRFETLTLIPIDRKLIDQNLLTKEEIFWINDYHQRVKETLADLLDGQDRNWLIQATLPL